ncbi:DUF3300 domain-containing protein [Petrachloros mirabilis]
MKTWNIIGLVQCVVLLLSSPSVFAQQETSQEQESLQQHVALLSDTPSQVEEQARPAFSQAELDQMLAPIALYPDSLLSQILMASTYPLEVVEAARWSRAHPELKGEEAVEAVAQYQWDPSVKSLVAFPQILATMDEQLDWMQRLGEAFLSQQQDVMDSIQKLRQAASAAGNLESNDQILVEQQDNSIVIQPANPQIVYVPYYDPLVIYGTWWWPAYRPVYWAPWPTYFVTPVSRFGVGFYWGFGVPIGPRCWFGAFNWPYRYVTYSSGIVWDHSPIHRRAVPYRNFTLQQRFGHVRTSPAIPPQFSGGQRAPLFDGQRSFGHHPGLHGGFGIRPEGRRHMPSGFGMQGGNRSDLRGVPSKPNFAMGDRPHVEQRMSSIEQGRAGMPDRRIRPQGRSSVQGTTQRLHGGPASSSGHGPYGRSFHRH